MATASRGDETSSSTRPASDSRPGHLSRAKCAELRRLAREFAGSGDVHAFERFGVKVWVKAGNQGATGGGAPTQSAQRPSTSSAAAPGLSARQRQRAQRYKSFHSAVEFRKRSIFQRWRRALSLGVDEDDAQMSANMVEALATAPASELLSTSGGAATSVAVPDAYTTPPRTRHTAEAEPRRDPQPHVPPVLTDHSCSTSVSAQAVQDDRSASQRAFVQGYRQREMDEAESLQHAMQRAARYGVLIPPACGKGGGGGGRGGGRCGGSFGGYQNGPPKMLNLEGGERLSVPKRDRRAGGVDTTPTKSPSAESGGNSSIATGGGTRGRGGGSGRKAVRSELDFTRVA